jgi:uncharacterized membrane protein
MKLKSIPATSFIILCALCVVQVAYYYPLLPETVPSHFGASGRPDAWSSKNFFVIFYLSVIAVISVLFLSLSFILSCMPVSLINMPHKEFWLAPERKEKTLTFLSQYLLLFALFTVLLLFDIFNQSFQVALGKAQALTHPLASILVYLSLILLWIICMFVKFGNPHNE